MLEKQFDFKLAFPNPYPYTPGLRLQRSINAEIEVISGRQIQAIHQALLLNEKLREKNRQASICEIGGGLGYTAFYAHALGYTDYTIIDLPITGVAQAHYLGTVLGNDAVTLYGETERPGTIRLLPPSAFIEDDPGRFDIVLNVDSLTEMDFSTMQAYWKCIKRVTDRFLSVNHEANTHTVRELVYGDPAIKSYTRTEYWLRRGYVEEYIQLGD